MLDIETFRNTLLAEILWRKQRVSEKGISSKKQETLPRLLRSSATSRNTLRMAYVSAWCHEALVDWAKADRTNEFFVDRFQLREMSALDEAQRRRGIRE
jgi:hypothetical protein